MSQSRPARERIAQSVAVLVLFVGGATPAIAGSGSRGGHNGGGSGSSVTTDSVTTTAAAPTTTQDPTMTTTATTRTTVQEPAYTFSTASSPPRTIVRDATGHWVATFTDGSYTVDLRGSSRTFAEASTPYVVNSATWVRLLPAPFDGIVDTAWLERELSDTSADVLAVAMQYVAGAANVYDGSGLRIAGDAGYGPLLADASRQEGSDFNDYLGIPWMYDGSADPPEAVQYGDVDCSGFVRMVFGYRGGIRMTLAPDGTRMPRRSYQIAASAPGVATIQNTGAQVTTFTALDPGDLVFFDASTDDGTQIDHVGIYLGVDSGGNYRFISSRKSANGPTLGDTNGRSILNGTGYYAAAFRAARRL